MINKTPALRDPPPPWEVSALIRERDLTIAKADATIKRANRFFWWYRFFGFAMNPALQRMEPPRCFEWVM